MTFCGKAVTPLFILILSLAVYNFFDIYNSLGLQRVLYNHYPGPCRVVEGIEFGAEKIVVLPNGVAIMTSGYKLEGFHNTSAIKDPGLYMFDFNQPSKNVTRLKFSSNYDLKVRDRHESGVLAFAFRSFQYKKLSNYFSDA